jgi:hypothetical protein
VFTIQLPESCAGLFIRQMAQRRILLSHESEYLKKRSWSQLALFGFYREEELEYGCKVLDHCVRLSLGVFSNNSA